MKKHKNDIERRMYWIRTAVKTIKLRLKEGEKPTQACYALANFALMLRQLLLTGSEEGAERVRGSYE